MRFQTGPTMINAGEVLELKRFTSSMRERRKICVKVYLHSVRLAMPARVVTGTCGLVFGSPFIVPHHYTCNNTQPQSAHLHQLPLPWVHYNAAHSFRPGQPFLSDPIFYALHTYLQTHEYWCVCVRVRARMCMDVRIYTVHIMYMYIKIHQYEYILLYYYICIYTYIYIWHIWLYIHIIT